MSQENNFIPSQDGYKPLTPFKLFVKSNFPFIEATYEALDNYGLYCKIVEYLNTVIENENTVESNVQALYDAFVSLNNYVSDYFDNLDVQEEINNKLDDLVEDGTLGNLIGVYVQPLIDEQNLEISNFKNTINNELDVMDNKITQATSGSPLVASSVAGMTNTSRIYVNTSDGNWYYYNGTEWVIGGVYQATSAGENSVNRAAFNYSLYGDLFSPNGDRNQKINLSYDSGTTNLTVSTNKSLYINNGNQFYTLPQQNISANLTGNVMYLILDVSSTPTLQLIENPSLLLANKGSYYTLGYIYNLVFHAITDKFHFMVSGLRVQDDNVILASDRNGYIKVNNSNNTIQLVNVYVLENGVINNLNTILSTDSLESLHYCIWNGSTLEIKGANENIDYNRVVFTIYQNQIYGTHDIRIINTSRNPNDLCNIILGNINVSFNDMKVYINNIYIAEPGLTGANLYANTANIIEIPIPDTANVYNLYYTPNTHTFELLRNQQNRETSGKWWILSFFGNKVYPMIDASNIRVNNIPYYETVIDVETNAAIELSLNDVFAKLADKTEQTNITIVGDSIAHGVGGTGFNQNGDTIITVGSTTWKRNPDGYCWANLFKDYIENNYNAVVTNNACTGTTSGFLKAHINTLIPTTTDIVIICYGTNNRGLATSDNYNNVYNTTVSDFNDIIAYCENNNIKYCICSPIPSSQADEERVDGDNQRFVHLFQINNIIKAIASNKKFEYVNMYNAIKEYCYITGNDWDNYLSDGLHPNNNGYKVMFYEYMFKFGLGLDYIDV